MEEPGQSSAWSNALTAATIGAIAALAGLYLSNRGTSEANAVAALAEACEQDCAQLLADLPNMFEADAEHIAEPDDVPTVYRGLVNADTPSLDEPSDSTLTPAIPQRVRSEDVQQAVNKVLLPKLIAHQHAISDARKRMRKGLLRPVEAKALIHESSRLFTERYADAVRTAKSLANETGIVPLRRLASSSESWAAAVLYAELQQSVLEESFMPGSQPNN